MERKNLLMKTANEIIIDDTNPTNLNTIQEVIIDDSAISINSADILKSGSVCVIFSTHPASNTSQPHQQQSAATTVQSNTTTHTSEQPQQQPTQTISVNPVVRDISSSGSVMTG